MKRTIEVTLKRKKDGARVAACRLTITNATSEVGIDMTAIDMPGVTYQWVGQRGIDDYAERKHKKIVDGYSIKLADSVLFNVFILADGTHEFENLYSDLITLAANATSQAGWLRGAVQNANGFAHTTKRYVETYKHFFGPLSEDQLKWMEDNLPTFEQEMAFAKEKAKLNINSPKKDN